MNFEEMLRLIDKVSDSSLSSFEYETEELKLSIQCGEKAVLTAAPMVSETELRENVSGKKGGACRKENWSKVAAGRRRFMRHLPRTQPPM